MGRATGNIYTDAASTIALPSPDEFVLFFNTEDIGANGAKLYACKNNLVAGIPTKVLVDIEGGGGINEFLGTFDCSTNPDYPAAIAGQYGLISVAGKIGGVLGKPVNAGDMIIANTTNAGGDEATVGTDWDVIENVFDAIKATKAQAYAGTDNNSYMTPQAVRQAIQGGAFISGQMGNSAITPNAYTGILVPGVLDDTNNGSFFFLGNFGVGLVPNSGAATLEIEGTTALPLKKLDITGNFVDVEANDILPNRTFIVGNNGTGYFISQLPIKSDETLAISGNDNETFMTPQTTRTAIQEGLFQNLLITTTAPGTFISTTPLSTLDNIVNNQIFFCRYIGTDGSIAGVNQLTISTTSGAITGVIKTINSESAGNSFFDLSEQQIKSGATFLLMRNSPNWLMISQPYQFVNGAGDWSVLLYNANTPNFANGLASTALGAANTVNGENGMVSGSQNVLSMKDSHIIGSRGADTNFAEEVHGGNIIINVSPDSPPGANQNSEVIMSNRIDIGVTTDLLNALVIGTDFSWAFEIQAQATDTLGNVLTQFIKGGIKNLGGTVSFVGTGPVADTPIIDVGIGATTITAIADNAVKQLRLEVVNGAATSIRVNANVKLTQLLNVLT